jgi:hypothetical protein
MLIAQAQIEKPVIVTRDARFGAYGIKTRRHVATGAQRCELAIRPRRARRYPPAPAPHRRAAR